LIDGEGVCCDDSGMAVFAKLRRRRNDRQVVLYAFDLLELDGQDLRREPLVTTQGVVGAVARQGEGGATS
jgi:ATP-dependent DNA ligase